jgi:aspartyl protease
MRLSLPPLPAAAAMLVLAAAGAIAGSPPAAQGIRVHIAAPTTLPFDSPSGLVIVTGRINGRAHVRLLLDTGDPSGFTLDISTARAIGLPLSGKTATLATGVVGSERYSLYRARVRSFLLGGLSARDLTIWTAPDAVLIAKTIGVRVDGFVGVDLLRDLRVILDYPSRQITFVPPGSPPEPVPPAADPSYPMRLTGNRILVDVVLNGSVTRPMILDTAAGTTFISDRDLGLTHAPASGRTTQITDSSGSAISVPVRILSSLSFGGAVDQDVPVVPFDFVPLNRDLFSGAAGSVAGILGSDVLSRHVVVIDFPAGCFGAAPARP